MRHSFPLSATAVLVAAISAPVAFAQSRPPGAASAPESGEVAPPTNLPPIPLFDAIERDTGIKLFGIVQFGYSTNDVTSHDQATAGHSNFPIVGSADEGLQFNEIHFVVQKQMRSDLLPRISPLPGPVPRNFSWGFREELLYGRNGLPAEMHGIETSWGIDRDPSGQPPGTTRQSYLALPQVYAEFYFPIWQGAALTVGRLGAGIGREIPPDFSPGPNFFYSKTYAFVAQPGAIFGALASVNLMRNDRGFLLGELGIAQGQQNLQDNNPQKSVIGALRWRSPDLQTSIDYSFMVGDEQNSPDTMPQLPQSRVISPHGQLRQYHSLVLEAHPFARWGVVGEVAYGSQAGDGQPDTIDVLTGPGYRGGRFAGINGEIRYRVSGPLRLALRGETFFDRSATALFPATRVAGDFHAVTAGARYDIARNIVFRPEVRYDWQGHNRGVNAFGDGKASHQTTLSADVLLSF